jgi:hypothetical protein
MAPQVHQEQTEIQGQGLDELTPLAAQRAEQTWEQQKGIPLRSTAMHLEI